MELITTLPKYDSKLEVGETYLRADGGIVEIVDENYDDSKRPFEAVRSCSGKSAGFYSPYGTKCRGNNGEDRGEGSVIVARVVSE